MRRVIAAVVIAVATVMGTTGAALAAPAAEANCIAEVALSFSPGTLGSELRVQARGTGLGWLVGGNGSGLAPSDPSGCG